MTDIAPVLRSPEDELAQLKHENTRLRTSLSLRGRLEEVVAENARLRRTLQVYGRHTNPHCHDIVAAGGVQRVGCLCGLNAAISGDCAVETSAPSPRFAGLVGEWRAPKAGDKCGHCGREWLAVPQGGQGVYHECHTGPSQQVFLEERPASESIVTPEHHHV